MVDMTHVQGITELALRFVLAPGSEAIVDWCTKTEGERAVARILDYAVRGGGCSRDHALVADIGANYGFYGVWTAVAGCRVVVAEPQPTCQKGLRWAANANNITARFRMIRHAVSYPAGTIPVSETTNCDGRFPISTAETHPSEVAAMYSGIATQASIRDTKWWLDTTIDIGEKFGSTGETLRFVKIDTEGNEITVLQSLLPLIFSRKIEHLVVETTPLFYRTTRMPFARAIAAFDALIASGYRGVTLTSPAQQLESIDDVRAFYVEQPFFVQVDVWWSCVDTLRAMCSVAGPCYAVPRNSDRATWHDVQTANEWNFDALPSEFK